MSEPFTTSNARTTWQHHKLPSSLHYNLLNIPLVTNLNSLPKTIHSLPHYFQTETKKLSACWIITDITHHYHHRLSSLFSLITQLYSALDRYSGTSGLVVHYIHLVFFSSDILQNPSPWHFVFNSQYHLPYYFAHAMLFLLFILSCLVIVNYLIVLPLYLLHS